VTKTDVAVEMYWICALILPRCTQESVVIYGHLLCYCEGAKYILVLVRQYCKSIGICITILIKNLYWYWYWQYFVKVLLTTLHIIYDSRCPVSELTAWWLTNDWTRVSPSASSELDDYRTSLLSAVQQTALCLEKTSLFIFVTSLSDFIRFC